MRSMVETCKSLLRRLSKSNASLSILNIEGEDSWHRFAGATLSSEGGPEPMELHDPTSNLACDAEASKLQEPAHESDSFAPIYVEERRNEPSAEEEPLAAGSLQAGEIPEVIPSDHRESLSLSPSVTREEIEMSFQRITYSASPSSPEIGSLISPDLQAIITGFAIKVSQAYSEPKRTSSDPLLLPAESKPSVSFEEVSGIERPDDLARGPGVILKPDALSQTGFDELRWSGGERRRMPREAHSGIVWVEYLNESLKCIGREAARAQDVSGGGMRIQVKAAPSDCEVLRVSHPNCSFDTYATVRSRFVGEGGYDHLCLRFLDSKPSAHPAPAQMQKVESGQSGGPRAAPKILLADDDASLRKVLAKILTQAGYEVSTAEDGVSAIEKAQVEKPDLVISDLLMPKGNGFHVCKMIKGLDSPPRVILFSGVFTKPHYRWAAREEYGADDMVTKPFELADLLGRIKKQLSSPSSLDLRP